MRASRGLGAVMPRKLKGLKSKNPTFKGDDTAITDLGKKPGAFRKQLRVKPGKPDTKRLTKP